MKFKIGDRIITDPQYYGTFPYKGTIIDTNVHLTSEPEEFYYTYSVMFDSPREYKNYSMREFWLKLLIDPNSLIKEIL